MKTLNSLILWVSCIGLALHVSASASHELVNNGDFASVFQGWSVAPELANDLPFDTEMQALVLGVWPDHSSQFTGTYLSQAFNLPVSSGKTLQVAMDLQAMWPPFEGHDAGLYLEYLDADQERHRVLALNPDNEEIEVNEWTRFSTTHVVPAGMTRLVGMSLDKMGGWDTYFARGISVRSSTAGGPVPQLRGVSPGVAFYGGSVVLRGEHFGSVEGRVTIGGTAAGVDVIGWSDTEIQIQLDDPCADGLVVVEAAGSRSWQSRWLRVGSPHYTLDIKRLPLGMHHDLVFTHPRALPGQPLHLAVFTRFFNGFQPASGIALSALQPATGVTFTENPIHGAGGSMLTLDTEGLEPGWYTLEVQADDGGLLPRTASIAVEVVDVDQVVWYGGEDPLDESHFTAQGGFPIYPVMRDSMGAEIMGMENHLTVTSSHPSQVEVFHDSGPWGGYVLCVHDSTSATLTTTLPDGRTFTQTVHATIPDSPRIVSSGYQHPTMSNFPGYETSQNRNVLYFNGSSGFSRVGASWWGPFISDGFVGSGANRGWAFFASEYLLPGKYLIAVRGEIGGVFYGVSRILNVVNDPNTGLLAGRVIEFIPSDEGHGTYGTLELYDDSSGVLLHEIEIFGDEVGAFTAARVPPGSYRAMWYPGDIGFGTTSLPQWYPNASRFEDAQTLVVTAGSAITDIDFLLVPPTEPPPVPKMSAPPSYNPATNTFSMTLQAVDGQRYDLQKSLTMRENTWITVDSNWGWEGSVSLSDPNCDGERAFYRVVAR